MSPVDLTSELRRAADATAASILEGARAEAERIVNAAQQRIDRQRRDALREHEAAYRSESRYAVAAARHEAMDALLKARTEIVDRVLEEAEARLAEACRSERYRERLPAELADALRFVPEGEAVTVRCAPELRDAVGSALGDRAGARVEADPEVGDGFVVIGEGGVMRIDQRLTRKLEEARTDLAIAILGELERGGDGPVPR